ncbi:late competence development ComFB family protein [Alicyclobacillus acidiphilus]|uniref:late competence development ComFB family protein n=1 Tax=Alicyclobacillus acidiphilus TaxID=182455 RepID=UPI00082F796F|nr:late competence development ComFB family protein [Alicyclobacillus acidiphilus]
MTVFNYTEQLAKEMLKRDEINSILTCKCEQCVDDVLAMALNKLPARYVSTESGRVFVKANYMQPQLQSDVLKELTSAAMVVASHPHHSRGEQGGSV